MTNPIAANEVLSLIAEVKKPTFTKWELYHRKHRA